LLEQLGITLPEFKITKITLETTGNEYKESDNPHVVERTPNSYIDEYGHIRWDLVTDETFQEPNVEPKLLKMIVDIELSKMFNSKIFDVNIGKYFLLRVIHSHSAGISNAIERGEKAKEANIPSSYYEEKYETLEKNKRFFQFQFILPHDTPQHTTLFINYQLAIQELLSDFEIDVEVDNVYSSQMFKYSVIDNSAIVSNVVQDFRIGKLLERLQFDFTSLDSLTSDIYSLSPVGKLAENKISSISEIRLSRGINNECRFQFDIDFLRLLSDNSLYARYFKKYNNETFLKSAAAKSSIKYLEITRHRVNADEGNIQRYDENNFPPTMIVWSGDIGERKWNFQTERKMLDLDQNGEPETLVGAIRADRLHENSNIRSFQGVDHDVSEHPGQYQYRIFMRVEDGTYYLLRDIRNSITSAIIDLEQYYNEGTQLSRNIGIQDEKGASITWRKVLGNYDPERNRFTDLFIRKMRSTYKVPTLSPWVASIKKFIDSLQILSVKNLSLVGLERLAVMLKVFLSPETGNPSGVLWFLKILRTLESKLDKLVGTSSDMSNPIRTTKSTRNVPLRHFEVEKKFRDVYNGSRDVQIVVDFLGELENEIEEHIGLREIDLATLGIRTERDVGKYFQDGGRVFNLVSQNVDYSINDSTEISRLRYLSPDSILVQTPTSKEDTVNQNRFSLFTPNTQESTSEIAALANAIIISADQDGNPIYPFDIENQEVRSLERLSSKTGITVVTLEDDSQKIEQAEGDQAMVGIGENDDTLRAMEQLTNKSPFIQSAVRSLLKKVTSEDILKKIRVDEYNLTLNENLLKQSNLSDVQVKNLPNPVKALFLESISPEKLQTLTFQPSNDENLRSLVNLKFKTLSKIEILIGYNVDENKRGFSMMDPIWVPIDIQSLKRIKNSRYVCKISYYENASLKIEPEVKMEILNSYFVLRTPTSWFWEQYRKEQPALVDEPVFTIGPSIEPIFAVEANIKKVTTETGGVASKSIKADLVYQTEFKDPTKEFEETIKAIEQKQSVVSKEEAAQLVQPSFENNKDTITITDSAANKLAKPKK